MLMPTHLSFDQSLYILDFNRGVNLVLVHGIRSDDSESHAKEEVESEST